MDFNPAVIWFLLGLILALLEFAVPGVILIFFGIGAWVVAAATYLGITKSLGAQLLSFATVSGIVLVILRERLKGKLYGHEDHIQDLSQNLDEFTGKSVIVRKDVLPGKLGGKVEFKGATWSAVSDEPIKKGQVATITGVNGITLKVRKSKEA